MPAVILKADDLRLERITDRWKRFLRYCKEEGVFCNAGVISGRSVDVKEAQIANIREVLNSLGMNRAWALWNHGFEHERRESPGTSDFRGVPLAQQIRSLRRSQETVERIAGVRPDAFGPPFNAWDHNTIVALQHFPEIRNVFYVPYVPGKICYGSELFVEAEPFLGEVKPGAKRAFSLEEAKRKSERFLNIDRSFVLQVHPNSWRKPALDAFSGFVDYMRKAGYIFRAIGEPDSDEAPGRRTA